MSVSGKPWLQTTMFAGLAIWSVHVTAQQTAPSAPAGQSAAAVAAARAASAAAALEPARRVVSLNAALTAASPVVTLEALASMRMLEQLRELQAKVLALNPPLPTPAQVQPPKASAPPPAAELLALQKVLEPAPAAPPRLNRVVAIYGPQYALQAEIIKASGEVIVVKPGVVHESLRITNITPDLVELEVRTTAVPATMKSALQQPANDQVQGSPKRRRALPAAVAAPAAPPSSEVVVLRLRVGATFE